MRSVCLFSCGSPVRNPHVHPHTCHHSVPTVLAVVPHLSCFCPLIFPQFTYFNPYSSPMKQILLFQLHFPDKETGTEKLNNLPKVTHLVDGRGGFWIHTYLSLMLTASQALSSKQMRNTPGYTGHRSPWSLSTWGPYGGGNSVAIHTTSGLDPAHQLAKKQVPKETGRKQAE